MDGLGEVMGSAWWWLPWPLLLAVLWWMWRRTQGGQGAQAQAWQAALQAQSQRLERLETQLRHELAEQSRLQRQEQQQGLAGFQSALLQQSHDNLRTQNTQLDGFAQQLVMLRGTLADTLTQQLQALSEGNAQRLSEVRATLESQLQQLQQNNATKLEEMRATVDEKLQQTLQTRLSESFAHVAQRLEQVHKGLGEMQHLATGVGDLKDLLANVKTRGMFGEAQLGALLEQALTPQQYVAQQATRPGSKQVVDFAVRLPGKGEQAAPVWLPIDAKFPTEDYQRLLQAQGKADLVGAEAAARALEQRIRTEAKSIADKYLQPPHTTDFALMFLPSEGLYAEVLRRPGLFESVQRDYRVTLTGPTTLMALLNALHMGFRTLALEQRSSEVWQVLGAVKTEFGKFGGVLEKLKSQTQTVLNGLDQAQVRSRAMGRALREVEAAPTDAPAPWLAQPQDEADAADSGQTLP
jgi:DNA recombination protein RmuC